MTDPGLAETQPVLDRAKLAELASIGGAAEASLAVTLLRILLDQIPGTVAEIARAVGAHDAAAIERRMHDVKSVTGTVGAMRIYALARSTEAACREGRVEQACAEAARLPQEFALLREEIDRYFRDRGR